MIGKGFRAAALAVQSGAWPLYRYNPALIAKGQNHSHRLEDPTIPISQYAYNETRYRMLLQTDEQRAEMLIKQAQGDVKGRWHCIARWPPCTMMGRG